jgi:hypothetical protein
MIRRFSRVYRILLQAARAEGIGLTRLPDFLGLEHGGELALLGQEELDISVLEASLRDQLSRHSGGTLWSELETGRILLAAVRVGQHVFAQQVLTNCGSRCVFCGLRPTAFGAKRMLMECLRLLSDGRPRGGANAGDIGRSIQVVYEIVAHASSTRKGAAIKMRRRRRLLLAAGLPSRRGARHGGRRIRR